MFKSIEDCRKYITCSQDYKFLPVGFDAYKIEELVIATNKMELGVRGVTV